MPAQRTKERSKTPAAAAAASAVAAAVAAVDAAAAARAAAARAGPDRRSHVETGAGLDVRSQKRRLRRVHSAHMCIRRASISQAQLSCPS
eukprot:6182102-Pleurochrysis_carterae.AAC.2